MLQMNVINVCLSSFIIIIINHCLLSSWLAANLVPIANGKPLVLHLAKTCQNHQVPRPREFVTNVTHGVQPIDTKYLLMRNVTEVMVYCRITFSIRCCTLADNLQ